jgi:hypothetical protein
VKAVESAFGVQADSVAVNSSTKIKDESVFIVALKWANSHAVESIKKFV